MNEAKTSSAINVTYRCSMESHVFNDKEDEGIVIPPAIICPVQILSLQYLKPMSTSTYGMQQMTLKSHNI